MSDKLWVSSVLNGLISTLWFILLIWFWLFGYFTQIWFTGGSSPYIILKILLSFAVLCVDGNYSFFIVDTKLLNMALAKLWFMTKSTNGRWLREDLVKNLSIIKPSNYLLWWNSYIFIDLVLISFVYSLNLNLYTEEK